jgi:toxin ParE1/3/4
MRLVLHPKVYSDIDEIMGYYERVATPGLAEEFYNELRYFMSKAADKPESFSLRERDIRRANLRRFPYHFLFRVVGHESEFSSSAITIDIPSFGCVLVISCLSAGL